MLDISILVNNVGQIMYGKLGVHDSATHVANISVNINAVTYMSMYLLPRLLRRRRRSAVVNLTSKLAYLGMGDFGPYGACKSYVSSLT